MGSFENCSEYDMRDLEKILQGEDIETFRFFGEMGELETSVLGINIYSNKCSLVECRLENPEYGKADIVPIDYPIHEKRRTYICDIKDMFESRYGCSPCFVRKTSKNAHIVTKKEIEQVTNLGYIVHEYQELEE